MKRSTAFFASCVSLVLLSGCVAPAIRRPVIVNRSGPVIMNGRQQPMTSEPAGILTDARMIGVIRNSRPSDVVVYLEKGEFEVATNDDGTIPDEQLVWRQVLPQDFFVLGPTEETPRLRCVGGRRWMYVQEQEGYRGFVRNYWFLVNFRRGDQPLGLGRVLDWWALVPNNSY